MTTHQDLKPLGQVRLLVLFKRLIGISFILFLTICAITKVVAQDKDISVKLNVIKPETELTEVQKLKSEIFKLKTQLAQCSLNSIDLQARIESANLTSEQQKLEEEFRASLKPEPGAKFNWTTMKFENEKKSPPLIK